MASKLRTSASRKENRRKAFCAWPPPIRPGTLSSKSSDDGRGLDTEKILRKAREKGLVPEGNNPSESEIFHLIFEPGFSTADQITDVSGRGVGMDVVRRQIQGLRGRIEIRSTPGRGSTFLLKLPLTLAIIEGLIVQVGGERYIMPISSVREMLRPAPEMLFTIENRAEMAMIRGELLPVLRLDRRFHIPRAVQNPCEGLFVVVESEGRRFCLLVDEMLGNRKSSSRALGETFQHVAGISGGAILGDGRVGLILDSTASCRAGRGSNECLLLAAAARFRKRAFARAQARDFETFAVWPTTNLVSFDRSKHELVAPASERNSAK